MSTLENNKSILCVYHPNKSNTLDIDSWNLFKEVGYSITTAYCYTEALSLIESNQFAYILTDLNLQRVSKPGVPLLRYGDTFTKILDPKFVKGFGLFVPINMNEAEFQKSKYSHIAHVTSNECWTKCGDRDWKTLFDKILQKQE